MDDIGTVVVLVVVVVVVDADEIDDDSGIDDDIVGVGNDVGGVLNGMMFVGRVVNALAVPVGVELVVSENISWR